LRVILFLLSLAKVCASPHPVAAVSHAKRHLL